MFIRREKCDWYSCIEKLNDEHCELKSFYLLEQYHKKGLGYQLLKTAILKAQQDGYKEMYLDTLSSSTKAISLLHQSVFTKESDKYQWLVLEQTSQSEVEVTQTDNHEIITARDNYELTRNIPKCVSVERLCEGANFQIPFNADVINLIYQFGEQGKAETCANLSAILPQIKDSETKQIVSATLDKLNVLLKQAVRNSQPLSKGARLSSVIIP